MPGSYLQKDANNAGHQKKWPITSSLTLIIVQIFEALEGVVHGFDEPVGLLAVNDFRACRELVRNRSNVGFYRFHVVCEL
jgi:hypothetical protein